MKKKILLGVVLIIVLVLGWFIFDYYHYFPPNKEKEQIVKETQKILEHEAEKILEAQNNWNRSGLSRQFGSLRILDVKEINGTTYLVFKLDFYIDTSDPKMGYQYNGIGNGYMLGLRQVEQKLGKLSLQKGMEFESNYLSTNPADCGQDTEGNFYAYCKDPRISRVVLESDGGKAEEVPVNNRVVLASVADPQKTVTPRFFTAEGTEIELSYGMRVAFVSNDEKYYQQYTNTPMEWWNLSAKDVFNLTNDTVDAIWIFPDQQQDALKDDTVIKLKELGENGMALIFVGMKDYRELTRIFEVKEIESTIPESDIEAIYLGKQSEGSLQAGVIGLDENEVSPILKQSIMLKLGLQESDWCTPEKKPGQDGEVSDDEHEKNLQQPESVDVKKIKVGEPVSVSTPKGVVK